MKIQTQCVPCLLKRIIFETELSTKDPKIKKKTIRKACEILSKNYSHDINSAEIATKVHKIVYQTLEDDDPYKNLKKESNDIALSLAPELKDILKKSKDPLKMSIIFSIIGNNLDFGIEGASSSPIDLKKLFNISIKYELGYDDTDKFKKLLEKSKKVLFFSDNCGEIVFDKILCNEIKKYNPKIHLTLVVKGTPILSDATIKDANDLNFIEVVDEILTTNCFAVGIDFKKISNNLEEKLKEADLIICKGMANYESFSDTKYKPIAYFLRTKCDSIAKSMNLPININAVKLYQ
jgi:uncharacterized protein with ATP-grasp and redox domains